MKPVHLREGNLLYSKSADLNVAHILIVSVMLDCFVTLWTAAHQASLSLPCHFIGENTGVSCHSLLQGTLWIQGSNLRLLPLMYWQADSLPLAILLG